MHDLRFHIELNLKQFSHICITCAQVTIRIVVFKLCSTEPWGSATDHPGPHKETGSNGGVHLEEHAAIAKLGHLPLCQLMWPTKDGGQGFAGEEVI